MKVKYLYERWDLMKTEIHKGSYIIYGKLFILSFTFLYVIYLGWMFIYYV